MGNDTEKRDYEVGYGKPPPHTRFQKGKSGNPAGVREPRTLVEAAFEILQRPMTITINGKRRRLTTQQAMLMAAAQNSIKGKNAATRLLVDLIKDVPLPSREASKEETEADFQEAMKGSTVEQLHFLREFYARLDAISRRRKKY